MAAQGTALLDFGAFPGTSDASVAVTGQTAIQSGCLVEAWVFPAATADHTADEHWLEELKVVASSIVVGIGFTIHGVHTPAMQATDGMGTRLSGHYNIGWVWS